MTLIPRIRFTRNGPISFLRIGRWQLSWCRCKRAIGEPKPVVVRGRGLAFTGAWPEGGSTVASVDIPQQPSVMIGRSNT